MTYKVWERKLKKGLKTLPKSERDRTVEYYREMFDEMTVGGRSEESVMAEFGPPEKCARKVLSENAARSDERDPVAEKKPGKRFSAAELIGLMFFTVLLVLPIGGAMLGVLIAFGAVTVAGGAIGIAGLIFAIYFPFVGGTEIAVMAGIGMGLTASGVGLLLMTAFFFITKGLAIALGKTLKAIYVRR